ncbi:uncharacterized protein LOC120632049 [Pararge aegeria]|uniref:Jg7744 protein n=1 Tax=Pararge aegeria aegeria TaxID=348720 RepID=A0A8S4RYP2_9NEOP|nr:uncharacterized protein LOC120632049 [Pararge aegeria]CAH2244277.1 jg7744 [Pararge aegeria aegeria]
MSDKTTYEQDESTVLSADRTSDGEFFIDDYSHLRLSYYQYRDDITLDVSDSYQDSAYSTNASTNKSFRDATNSTNTNSTNAKSTNTNSTSVGPKHLQEEERRKLREFYISQIPDLPHPSYTAASIIASASHRMDPTNRFVYNKKIEQGTKMEDDMTSFTPGRRSTLKPNTKL